MTVGLAALAPHGYALTTLLPGYQGPPAAALADLADDPEVEFISPDRQVQGALDIAAATAGGNIAFMDGHAQWRPFKQMTNVFGNPQFQF